MNTVHIYYLKHSEKIDEQSFQQMLLLLPEQFQKEIKAYKHWESAQASLLGKILLLYGLKELKIADTLNELQQGEKERPFINNKFDFNISHSGEYITVAISEAKVGIDIEKHRDIDVSLFRKYFDDDEWNEIESSPDAAQFFFKLWAIKESAIKCDGRGVEVLSKTHVVVRPLQVVGRLVCDSQEFYYRLLDMDENYSCSVCSNIKPRIIASRLSLKGIELMSF